MSEILLTVTDLQKSYRDTEKELAAVRGVSFRLQDGEILGIVGESGCGKSTLARCIVRLLRPDAGQILWQGRDISQLPERELRPLRSDIQMVFQNPYASFNPRFTIETALQRAGRQFGLSGAAYEARRSELMAHCGLEEELLYRRPEQLSGGQLQRFALVRALLPNPRLLIADEAVSALDVAVQEPILALFRSLRDRYGIAVLFISHDLTVVRSLCQRLLVMYRGQIAEEGLTEEIFNRPQHPYTKELLAARLHFIQEIEQGEETE